MVRIYLTPALLPAASLTNNLGWFTSAYNRISKPDGSGTVYPLPENGPVGYTLAGQDIFPVYNNRGTLTPEQCESDGCNQHVGRGGGQPHLHGDPFGSFCFYSAANYSSLAAHPPLIGYAIDGFGIFGRHLSTSASGYSNTLDVCGGHSHDSYGYHYHAQVVEATTDTIAAPGVTSGLRFPASTPGVYQCFRGNLSADPYLNVRHNEPDAACCGSTAAYVKAGYTFNPAVRGPAQPSATATSSATATATSSATATATATATSSATTTASARAADSSAATATATVSATSTRTAMSPLATASATAYLSSSSTATATQSAMATTTATYSSIATQTSTGSATTTGSATGTETPAAPVTNAATFNSLPFDAVNATSGALTARAVAVLTAALETAVKSVCAACTVTVTKVVDSSSGKTLYEARRLQTTYGVTVHVTYATSGASAASLAAVTVASSTAAFTAAATTALQNTQGYSSATVAAVTTANAANTSANEPHNIVAIGVGVGVGGFVILLVGLWYFGFLHVAARKPADTSAA